VGRAIDPDVARRFGLAAVGVLWLLAVGWIIGWPWPTASPPGTVEVVHWANGHIAGDDVLLPAFATRFNAAGHRTAAGNRIMVKPYLVNSGQIEQELISTTPVCAHATAVLTAEWSPQSPSARHISSGE
jgi:hypothetical protein